MNKEALIEFSQNFGKGIGHPLRFKLLMYLVDGPHTVNDIALHLVASQSTTSQHLLVLKNANLIKNDKQGMHVYYSLNYSYITTGLEGMTETIKYKASKDNE
jgi:DNA-binding transcriptional ArsR family regulator